MFLFRLCLALGEPHPDYLRPKLNSKQVAEWEAYSLIEPFGERNRDRSFGIIGALVANMFRDGKKTPIPFTQEQFMTPAVDRKKLFGDVIKRPTVERSKQEVVSVFKSLAAALGKKKGRKKKE